MVIMDLAMSGKILYYLDANGKYDSIARLESLLTFAKEIGALENIVLLEEPFEEENKIIPSVIATFTNAEGWRPEENVYVGDCMPYKYKNKYGYYRYTYESSAKKHQESEDK